jgi:hypothetical protein
MAAFLVSKRDGANLQLSLADGGSVEVFPGVGGGAAGGALPLIFPTIATMSAYNIDSPVALLQGQQAFVQSNGSWWTLKVPDGVDVADGITIATATGAEVAKWVRENIGGYLPSASEGLAQLTWNIDQSNVTGTASDENPGTALLPLLTVTEMYRRLGYTWKPRYAGGVAIQVNYLSPTPAGGNDTAKWEPDLVDGSTFTQFAAQPAATFTGTLNVVTANSTTATPGNALESTFTVTSGAITANMLLINATRGNSRAVALRNLGGGNWLLTQPLAPYVAGTLPSPTNVDTWVSGDAITGFVPTPVDISRVGGSFSAINASVAPAHVLIGMTLVDKSAVGAGVCLVDLAAFPFFVDCVFVRPIQLRGPLAEQGVATFQGCIHTKTLTATQVTSSPAFSNSASYQFIQAGGSLVGCIGTCFNRVIAHGIMKDTVIPTPGAGNEIFIDTGQQIQLEGQVDATDANGAFYGPGTLNVKAQLTCIGTGAKLFGSLGATLLNGLASGYSSSGPASPKVISLVALTAAAFDAAAGAAGFGGQAFNLTGASIVKAGAQN